MATLTYLSRKLHRLEAGELSVVLQGKEAVTISSMFPVVQCKFKVSSFLTVKPCVAATHVYNALVTYQL